jgi:hypothetical protein
MHSFEDVRAYLAAKFELGDNDPYVISFELDMDDGRVQGVYLAELDTEQGRKYLRVSSPIAPIGEMDPARCLRFNWEQRVGFLALSDIDGVAYLHLCENRPFDSLSEEELEGMLREIGVLADSLERAMHRGRDVG